MLKINQDIDYQRGLCVYGSTRENIDKDKLYVDITNLLIYLVVHNESKEDIECIIWVIFELISVLNMMEWILPTIPNITLPIEKIFHFTYIFDLHCLWLSYYILLWTISLCNKENELWNTRMYTICTLVVPVETIISLR